ncbi:MAG TPA: NFACT RNA binding domain-containing protein [Longimicrobiales bacterium]|nr:NFACT RNA binding domain-containing protein [Longimicrobiales bacterium]
MSNAIRYDSLLVRELARALNDAFAGARLDGIWLDRDRLRLTLLTRPRRRGAPAPSLLWQLHPNSGHLTAAPGDPAGARVQLAERTVIRSVAAPPDERIIVFELDAEASAGMPRRLVVELITNQWNAVVVGGDGRIAAVLRERQARERTLKPGAAWTAPRPSGRPGAIAPLSLESWQKALGPVAPGERLAALPRLAALASPQNAAWILGDADTSDNPAALQRAWERYSALVHGAPPRPLLLQEDGRWQPYVAAPSADAAGDGFASLLDAFTAAAERAEAAPAGGVSTEEALDAVARRMENVHKRLARLTEEESGAAQDARRLRTLGDILLSQLHVVKRGMAEVQLYDFEGTPVIIQLDPALTPADNATRLYDTARKRERAAARIPELLARARRELASLEALAGRIREGTADAGEVEKLQRGQAAQGKGASPPLLPYREYRTTRGLEVRVGRGSKANDDLTFRHSSPSDIWLHARDVAGAHVILRWADKDANPPAADLHEAAVLAALHSRARTSGTVPVDWTRRKYVRKPRKAGPGLVIPERVRTLFVEPDEALEERMREP